MKQVIRTFLVSVLAGTTETKIICVASSTLPGYKEFYTAYFEAGHRRLLSLGFAILSKEEVLMECDLISHDLGSAGIAFTTAVKDLPSHTYVSFGKLDI